MTKSLHSGLIDAVTLSTPPMFTGLGCTVMFNALFWSQVVPASTLPSELFCSPRGAVAAFAGFASDATKTKTMTAKRAMVAWR